MQFGFPRFGFGGMRFAPGAGGGSSITNVDLLVVAGQSNGQAEGVSTVPSEVAAIDSSRVFIWNGSSFDGYVAGTNSSPSGQTSDKWGPEAQFAIRWLADNTDPTKGLYIVKRPKNGSLIASWQTGQTNFVNQKSWITSAVSALGTAGITINWKKCLWLQGESDAIDTQVLADAYYADLVSFLSDARSEWGITAVTLMRIYKSGMTYGSTVRAAQLQVCYDDASTFMVNTDDLTLGGTYHYNQAGVILIGDRMYDALVDEVGWEYETSVSLSAMTSASTPTGYVASASSEASGYEAWYAFDHVTNTNGPPGRWATLGGLSAADITLQLPSAMTMGAFKYYNPSGNLAVSPQTITVYGSNNGTDWTEIYTSGSLTWSLATPQMFEIDVANRGSYSYYRWDITMSGSGVSAREIEPRIAG